jgi:hypothetical protein
VIWFCGIRLFQQKKKSRSSMEKRRWMMAMQTRLMRSFGLGIEAENPSGKFFRCREEKLENGTDLAAFA